MSLGLAIVIDQLRADPEEAFYEFHVPPGRGGRFFPNASGQRGVLRVELPTGNVFVVRECPDDHDGTMAARAAVALEKRWRAGPLPTRVSWEA